MATPPPRRKPPDQLADRPHRDSDEGHPSALRVQLNHIAADLTRRFEGTFEYETVRRCVGESYDQLAQHARIYTHLPVLAARFARERLHATAKIQGAIVSTTPEVLFVCVHNAGRSQMAAALLHHHAAGTVTVRSAGSAPAETINPAVVEAMLEVGLDLGQEFPKPLTDESVQAADVVITMGCGDACPVYPGKRYLNWDLDDPAGKTVEQIRPIRDEIDQRVRELLAELTATRT
ncbi:arsenate reductase ArsC [Gandjariella thermophila]|uniref:Low molecular weight phosphatase family protein n=1 Tax=Gandjariella thermophila TaxID=1931992 RepID=A0A4D4JJA7_9PSEU|nr:arsenate reductase ArsC [Gandjariella thermophila]GDY33997.1 low molecular weight phosphatase family protein [Gandjariella thermophila]